jgi:hypothetical protein
MKFDVIVGNPPYKNGMHIDIFNVAFDYLKDAGYMIYLHPSTPFINRKPVKQNQKTKKINDTVSAYKSRITLIDGNVIFKNAGFFTPLSITKVQKVLDKKIEVVYLNNKEVKTYDGLNNIYIHGNDIVLKIKDKIFSKMTVSINDKLSRKGSFNKIYLKTNTVCGHKPKTGKNINPDFYCMIYKENENSLEDLITKSYESGDKNYISFENKHRALNCANYLLTKFARFCVSFYKINQNLHCGESMAVPYMDFSQEWTDGKLFNYFELTQKERDFINTYIQDWYDRDFK